MLFSVVAVPNVDATPVTGELKTIIISSPAFATPLPSLLYAVALNISGTTTLPKLPAKSFESTYAFPVATEFTLNVSVVPIVTESLLLNVIFQIMLSVVVVGPNVDTTPVTGESKTTIISSPAFATPLPSLLYAVTLSNFGSTI